MVDLHIFEATLPAFFFTDGWIMTPGSSEEKSHSFPSGECAGGWKQECDRLQNGGKDQGRWREEALWMHKSMM